MEIKKISELFGVAAPDTAQIEMNEPSFDTPEIDPAYTFSPDQIRRLQTWWLGKVKKSIFLTGPTGCGKTTLLEQFAARIGADFFLVPCHGKLDMAELLGSKGIAKDGSTFFEHGIGVRAMQHQRPCILAMDEMNFVPPGSIGLLNRITELKSFSIPETGEVITPMPWVRIAATGNAVERGDDAVRYRGTQAMNVALLNRFLGMRMNYMEATSEAAMLNTAIPGLHPRLIERLVELANEVRNGFAQGTLEVVMSTRTLLDMAQALFDRKALVAKNPVEEVNWAMEFCLTDLARPEDRDVVARLVQDKFHGLKLSPATATASPKPKTFSSAPVDQSNAEISFWIHPNRGAKGAAFWGYVESDGVCRSVNGNIDEAAPRDGEIRDMKWIADRARDKEAKGYTRVSAPCPILLPTGSSSSQSEVIDAVRAVVELVRDYRDNKPVQVPGNLQAFIVEAMTAFS